LLTAEQYRNRALFVCCLVLLALMTQVGRAQQSIVAADRSVDWRNVGIIGGIPNRTVVCATLNPGATAAQINNAIASCPSGRVVYLNAGVYNISGGITFNNKSNVTLRGAGANQTFLLFNSANGCHGTTADICLDSSDVNWRGGPSNLANWTAGYAKGTTVITLSNTANLAVGTPVTLDQLDDTSDNGDIYVCETGGCAIDSYSGGQRTDRAQQQIVTVTAINGSQVTISPGVYMPNWRSSQNPAGWWATSPIRNSGVEDLSMDHTVAAPQSGIQFFNCVGCWAKGVRSLQPHRAHILSLQSARLIVRDSYFFGSGGASQSYGIEIYPSSDTLIENNIFHSVTAPRVMNASCSGCVIAYNYSINDFYTASPNWMNHSDFMHAGGIDFVLLEGNVGAGMYSDPFHGTHHFVTLFRNRYNGWEIGKTSQTSPAILYPYSRFFNVIGNVLGDVLRPHNNYQVTTAGGGSISQSVYVLGTDGNGSSIPPDDSNVLRTVMRWGNYDIVSAANRFVSSEVPSGITKFANPVPPNQTLPASFYLSARPGWWPAGKPWPPIGPDVIGGNIPNVGGHAYTIPAQDCYTIKMGGPADGLGAALSFDASLCYPATAAPAPPTNLRIVIGN
jgi:hypothetical protein